MNILDIAIIIFVLLETGNVLILYFAPDSKLGNGVAVFNQCGKAKDTETEHLFVQYMTNWVAGAKLIFIVLLLVILFTGSELTKTLGVVAMIFSIATYYWRLHPIIDRLDELDALCPKGYSKTLFWMINGMMLLFSGALLLHFIL